MVETTKKERNIKWQCKAQLICGIFQGIPQMQTEIEKYVCEILSWNKKINVI